MTSPLRAASQAVMWTLTFLRLSVRELSLAGLFLLFPCLLIVVYAQAFGGTKGGFAEVLRVVVVVDGASRQPAQPFLDGLAAERFEGRPALSVFTSTDLAAAQRALRDGGAALVVDARGLGTGATELPLWSSAASGYGPYAETYARTALDRLSRVAAQEAGGASGRPQPQPEGESSFTQGSGTISDFLFGVPGVVLFGLTFGVMTVALLVVREVQRRTLDRIALSRAGAVGFALGLWGVQMVLGAVQAALVIGTARLVGLPAPAHPGETAVVLLLLVVVMGGVAVGGGLLTAAFSQSEGMAANVSMVFIAPLAFLSGAVFPLQVPEVARLGGAAVLANDFLPTAPAVRLLADVLVRGQSMVPSLPLLGLVVVEAAALVAVAAAVFGRRRLDAAR